MKNVMTGQTAVLAAAQALVPHRRAIMDMLVGHPHITTAEYDMAMQRTQACTCISTLQKWYRNCIREIARREEAAATPAPVQYATAQQTDEIHKLSLHRVIAKAERTQAILHLPRLDYAAAVALIAELQTLITSRGGTLAPAPAPSAATPAQCDEVYKLACNLPAREKADALRRLPYLTEREATAFILGLKLRRGPRYRVEVDSRPYTVAERHYNAAAVDYVQETGTGRVLPRYESLWGGPLVRRVWAN